MPSVEQLTAEELRKRGGAVNDELTAYPERSMAPVAQAVPGRPSIQALYDKLDVLNRQPLDYSGITGVNAARKQSADREMAGGLALSLMGGKHLAGAGNHVLVKALENQNPIRPNAADVGWTNPETGAFVENPMTERSGKEKLITGRIDALAKEQATNAQIALAAGDKRSHDIQMANAEQLKALLIVIAGQNANNHAVGYQAALDKANKITEDGLTNAQRAKISQHDADIATVESAVKAVEDAPTAFGVKRGLPKTIAGQYGESVAGRFDTDKERYARSRAYNEISALIKERAGTAQSAQELARINSFMPSDIDNSEQVIGKFKAYINYLKEQRTALNTVVPKNPGRAPAAPAAAASDAGPPPGAVREVTR